MLERLQKATADGPCEAELLLHTVNVQIAKKALIVSADQVGIIAQLRGPMGGLGKERMFPWSSISSIELV